MYNLFNPQTVAIIGASERKGSLGEATIKNLLDSEFPGILYAVNPKYNQVYGVQCFPNISALPRQVDCAIICVPSSIVLDIVQEAGQAGVRSAIVFASGFAEIGKEGEKLQEKLKEIAIKYHMPVCGPNCLGVINFREKFMGFSAPMDKFSNAGRVAAVSQSGSVSIALLNSGRGLDFSYVVSSGNEAVTTLEDYLKFFIEDDGTDVILAFVEGFRNTEKLKRVAEQAIESNKPIIVLKVGSSDIGKETVIAHTGALAGSEAVHEAFFKQYGILRVQDLDEMLETAMLFLKAPRPKGKKLGAIAISGGEVGLLADFADAIGLSFANLSKETKDGLRKFLPSFSNIRNPLDAWGKGDLKETYAKCLDKMGNDEGVDLVVVCQDAQAGLGESQAGFYEDLAYSVVNVYKKLDKPIILYSNISGGFHPVLRRVLDKGNVPTLQGTEESLRSAKHLIDFANYRTEKTRKHAVQLDDGRRKRALELLENTVLSEHASKLLLSLYGIGITEEEVAESISEAKQIAQKIGYPVVLKVNSCEIQHKTDVDVIRLHIKNEKELIQGYNEILLNAKEVVSPPEIDGVLVQEMLDLEDALEVIAGVKMDPQFGPVILFGIGGIFVEVFQDVALRVAPIEEKDAWAMIKEIHGAELLKGFRGKKAVDEKAIVDVLLSLSDLALELEEEVVEIDINPLVVFPKRKGAIAADALVVCEAGGPILSPEVEI